MQLFDKHKRDLFEVLSVVLLIAVLFFYFYYKNGYPTNPPYEFAFILVFLFSKNIRNSLFSAENLLTSLILTLILIISSYRIWLNDGIAFILYFSLFFISTKGFLGLWENIKKGIYVSSEKNKINPKRIFFEVFIVSLVSFLLIWLFIYYPSGNSPDTEEQWAQIHNTIPFTDVHAPLHTLLLKLLLLIWDSYAIVIIFNILLISSLAGLFSKYLYKKGIDRSWLIVLNITFAFATLSTLYMYPYKDVPYTFILGIITYLLMKTNDNNTKTGMGVIWGILLTLCYYFRYNGLVCVVSVSIYLVYISIKKRYIKQLIAFVLSFAILSIGLNLFIYQGMKCEHKTNGFSLQVFGSSISAVVAENGDITEEQLKIVDDIFGVKWIKENYNREYNSNLIWTKETVDPNNFFSEPGNGVFNNFFVIGLGENKMEVIKLWFQLLLKNPVVYLRNFTYNTYRIWGYRVIFSNIYLIIVLVSAISILWKKKHSKMHWIVFIPILSNILSIAISTITNEARYLMPTFTLFPALLFYIIASGKEMHIKK